MRIAAFLLLLPFCTSLMATGETWKCHSEQFTRAKSQLNRMVLTRAQKAAISSYEATFQREWRKTHSAKGCSHHESHANEFVAAAAGVLTDNQFKKFRRRSRNEIETVQHEVWQTGQYIDNLIKIASKI